MRPPDIEKLLGGYATGTLTPEERAALFEAALSNQSLFDALADEEALRELLADASARAELLEALRPPAPARRRTIFAWIWARPVPAALAASLAVAAVAIGVLHHRAAERREVSVAMRQAREAEARPGDSTLRVDDLQVSLAVPGPSPQTEPATKPPQPAARPKEERKDAKLHASGERDVTLPSGRAMDGVRPVERQLAPARDQVEERREASVPAATGGEKIVADEVAPRAAAATLAENEAPAAVAAAPPAEEHVRAAPPTRRAGRAALATPAAPAFEWALLSRDEGGEYRETKAREFPAGEPLRLRVVPRIDGHLYLTGQAGRPAQHRAVRAGEAAELPITGDAGVVRFRIVLSEAVLTGVQTRAAAGFSSAGAKSRSEPGAVEFELTFR